MNQTVYEMTPFHCLILFSVTFFFPHCFWFAVVSPLISPLVFPQNHLTVGVSFPPMQHTHESSRPIWLQAAESAYRFTLGSIAGGE